MPGDECRDCVGGCQLVSRNTRLRDGRGRSAPASLLGTTVREALRSLMARAGQEIKAGCWSRWSGSALTSHRSGNVDVRARAVSICTRSAFMRRRFPEYLILSEPWGVATRCARAALNSRSRNRARSPAGEPRRKRRRTIQEGDKVGQPQQGDGGWYNQYRAREEGGARHRGLNSSSNGSEVSATKATQPDQFLYANLRREETSAKVSHTPRAEGRTRERRERVFERTSPSPCSRVPCRARGRHACRPSCPRWPAQRERVRGACRC